MSANQMNGNQSISSSTVLEDGPVPQGIAEQPKQASVQQGPNREGANPSTEIPVDRYATRTDLQDETGSDKGKLLLLGGGLLLAVLFFVFTAVVGKTSDKRNLLPPSSSTQPSAPQEKSDQPKGSVTPLMEMAHTEEVDNSGGQVRPGDVQRMRSAESKANRLLGPKANRSSRTDKPSAGSLASVPSFGDTQQKWEDPPPYVSNGSTVASQPQQEQNALKEPSLVFVRSQAPSQSPVTAVETHSLEEALPLDLAPGTRIQAKLETQISSAVQAPVVAVVEYTYALGDQVVVPAGARVYGHLQQADSSGYVGVKFDELELVDGAREKIDAIGAGLDLGPIKGNVYGKNAGKSVLIRAASGLGSVATMLIGNNRSSAFSEDDLLRQRVAENLGNAGDSEVMSLAAHSRVVVSVPADTKIYIVFTKHESSPATLHRVGPTVQ